MTATSPIHRKGQFGANPTIDQKIEIFSAQVLGWQIGIAEEMARQFHAAVSNNDTANPMRHCGFAVVSVVCSYFETVAQYFLGESSDGKSHAFFKQGFRSVYPKIDLDAAQVRTIYGHIRCGMYHSGMTRPGVNIDEGHCPTFRFDAEGHPLINPFTLVEDVKKHFLDYVAQLQNPANTELRQNFENVFDCGVANPETSMLMGSGSGW